MSRGDEMKKEDAEFKWLVSMIGNIDKSMRSDCIRTLETIAYLMSEINSKRFESAHYARLFKHGKLDIKIDFRGDPHE